MIIQPSLIEFSRARNADIDCKFNSTVRTIGWAIKFNTEVRENPLHTIAAEILMREYVPSDKLLSCYYGYANGDDNLYPIE